MPIDHSTPAPSRYNSQQHKRSNTSGDTLLYSTTLPICAQSCTLAYVDQAFNCNANDDTCLCSRYSAGGYTLGEIALICLDTQCSGTSDVERGDAYNICVGRGPTVEATHTVLSYGGLPTMTSTSTPSPTSIKATSSTTIMPVRTTTGVVSSVPLSTASASSPAEQKSGDSTTLSTAQAVGIAIAALGVVVIAIVGFYLAVYLRRRKADKQKHQRHSYDFVDDAPPRFSPFKQVFASSRDPLDGSSAGCELRSEKHHTAWPVGYANATLAPKQYLRVVNVDGNHHPARSITPESPRSDCSMRTVSQLLPERPGSRPPQPPPKSPPASIMDTPATIFEEQRSPIPRALYPGLPAHPAAFKSQRPQYASPTLEQAKPPALSLSIPGKPYTVREAEGSTDFELLAPPPAITTTSNDRCDSADSNYRSSSHSLLKYYASADSGSSEDLYSATPIEEQTQVRRPPPAAITVSKPVFPPRAVRTSTASDASRRTSFESTDPDEPTPPEEEDKRLTPVAESPIAAIRYPKVPRSSNQSVPRSPNHQLSPKAMDWVATRYQLHDGQTSSRHSPSPSGSTLAAKRRGNGAQQDLELGLKIHDSAYASHSRKNSQQARDASQKIRPAHRQESPLKGYGRVANKVQRDSNWPLPAPVDAAVKSPPLRSPLWEPKLTPRREGDDLYLSVSVATPLDAHFQR